MKTFHSRLHDALAKEPPSASPEASVIDHVSACMRTGLADYIGTPFADPKATLGEDTDYGAPCGTAAQLLADEVGSEPLRDEDFHGPCESIRQPLVDGTYADYEKLKAEHQSMSDALTAAHALIQTLESENRLSTEENLQLDALVTAVANAHTSDGAFNMSEICRDWARGSKSERSQIIKLLVGTED